MPDVWFAYALPADGEADEEADRPLVAPSGRDRARDVPTASAPPPDVVDILLRPPEEIGPGLLASALSRRLTRPRLETQLAYNEAFVACHLTFEELLTEVLPLSRFWQRLWLGKRGTLDEAIGDRVAEVAAHFGGSEPRQQGRRAIHEHDLPGDLIWLIGLVGRIAWARPGPGPDTRRHRRLPTGRDVVRAALEILGPVELGPQPEGELLAAVSSNRTVEAAVWRSRIACKADAAKRVFDMSCVHVRWAVIDSGIDARHPAFAKRSGDHLPEIDGSSSRQSADSRVHATWDFAKVRQVLAGEAEPDAPDDAQEPAPLLLEGPEAKADEAAVRVARGRIIDWAAIAPRLAIPHDDDYTAPCDDHGTHVAGILASDWRAGDRPSPGRDDVLGVCPDIGLYDLRAFDDDGKGDEFSVLSAMQFVRYLNSSSERPVVHGVNLSFAIPHDVKKYAAGRTPVCDEAHRLVGSGVIVVAAAGNDGRGGYVVKGRSVEGYRTVSIADPGNAEKVITVGATHRDQPHVYGVSYFSSRGPTGDGRLKPDLVAPGERITSPVPDAGLQSKDGTSQAAPHVSGACALLLARHPELIGQPERVKEILMATCTDLGRDASFQGAGMVDILRAVQAA